jgi:hypothetical protein
MAIASAARPVAAARVLPMPAMIRDAAVLGKARNQLGPRGLARALALDQRMLPSARAC